ncbi:uncharacterized protein LOC126896891 [Daktulosphaira vitifoliae]|uniref:uncharacterized protein LOC126896891 n=1 Tax=Daktulosphaira vitifoliae TaxID=58002 RepID=UPI0021AAB8FC|nr:uncharacterized protein LOC126896891 [Daktulosphaira vitifoliae]
MDTDLLLGSPNNCSVRLYHEHFEVIIDLRSAFSTFFASSVNVTYYDMGIVVILQKEEYTQTQETECLTEKLTKKTITVTIPSPRAIKSDPRNTIRVSPEGFLEIAVAWK